MENSPKLGRNGTRLSERLRHVHQDRFSRPRRLITRLIPLWAILAIFTGCGPKPGSIGVGVDANSLWTHERPEWKYLKPLAAYCRDSHFQTIRVTAPQDWPLGHLAGLSAWAKLTHAPEIIVDLIPWPLDQTESEWRHFVRQAVTAFVDHPRDANSVVAQKYVFMVSNEPNRMNAKDGNPELWAKFYRLLREEAPSVKIVGPALGHSTPRIQNDVWLEQFFRAGGTVDYLGVHPYDRYVSMAVKMRGVLRRIGKPDMEIWAIESSGRTSTGGVGPTRHVRDLQRYGYSRVVFHVLGAWRPDRRAKNIDHFILFNRDANGIVPMSGDADELKSLGRRMRP